MNHLPRNGSIETFAAVESFARMPNGSCKTVYNSWWPNTYTGTMGVFVRSAIFTMPFRFFIAVFSVSNMPAIPSSTMPMLCGGCGSRGSTGLLSRLMLSSFPTSGPRTTSAGARRFFSIVPALAGMAPTRRMKLDTRGILSSIGATVHRQTRELKSFDHTGYAVIASGTTPCGITQKITGRPHFFSTASMSSRRRSGKTICSELSITLLCSL
mmetsp:Transcript_21702/g.54755  ORF Transcript_21702/g.54755 Transcript_21702/m.54755 type:complete len:212 (+) Transcript_21702:364-999(+)